MAIPTHPDAPSFHDRAPELRELLGHLPREHLVKLAGDVRRAAAIAQALTHSTRELVQRTWESLGALATVAGEVHAGLDREALTRALAACDEAKGVLHAATQPIREVVGTIDAYADQLDDAQRLALRAEVERLLPEAHAGLALQAAKVAPQRDPNVEAEAAFIAEARAVLAAQGPDARPPAPAAVCGACGGTDPCTCACSFCCGEGVCVCDNCMKPGADGVRCPACNYASLTRNTTAVRSRAAHMRAHSNVVPLCPVEYSSEMLPVHVCGPDCPVEPGAAVDPDGEREHGLGPGPETP